MHLMHFYLLLHPLHHSGSTTSPRPRVSHHKKSSAALSDLAFTGMTELSSSALAQLTSRLSILETSPERTKSLEVVDREVSPSPFNPYKGDRNDRPNKSSEVSHSTESGNVFGRNDRVRSATHPIGTYPTIHITSDANQRNSTARPPSIPFLDLDPYPTPASVPAPRSPSLKGDSNPMRRWTLALTDVSDEVLVQELEKLRREGKEREQQRRNRKSVIRPSEENDALECNGKRRRSSNKIAKDVPCSFVYGGPAIDSSNRRFQIGEPDDDGDSVALTDSDDEGEYPCMSDETPEDQAEDEAGWKTARRALFCCRELIRTERSYQARLRQFLAGDVIDNGRHSSVPPAILAYIPSLIVASEAFLARLEDDPSAWGVSTAFIGCEEEMERAFESWCSVVGELFIDESLARKSTVSDSGHSGESNSKFKVSSFGAKGRSKSGVSLSALTSLSSHGHGSERKRATSYYGSRATSLSPSSSSESSHRGRHHSQSISDTGLGSSGMFTVALGTGLALGLSPPHVEAPDYVNAGAASSRTVTASANVPPHPPRGAGSVSTLGLARTLTPWRKKTAGGLSAPSLPLGAMSPVTPGSPTSVKSSGGVCGKEKKPTLKDLAIQPTQRVTRYVLQYRDLLNHTPVSSPSRALVERALESATRIAEKCNRAQGNSAFSHR
ncbi:hypothetical protein C8Q75DRAFT_441644 [Abortiporus biennis]|nr:hypothetical protein C8Q75DRAFT_441644 [Abortiporus biennis]